MTELSENTGVGMVESMAFSAGDMLYASMLRPLVVEKIDTPDHMYDERALAMLDGLFGYNG